MTVREIWAHLERQAEVAMEPNTISVITVGVVVEVQACQQRLFDRGIPVVIFARKA